MFNTYGWDLSEEKRKEKTVSLTPPSHLQVDPTKKEKKIELYSPLPLCLPLSLTPPATANRRRQWPDSGSPVWSRCAHHLIIGRRLAIIGREGGTGTSTPTESSGGRRRLSRGAHRAPLISPAGRGRSRGRSWRHQLERGVPETTASADYSSPSPALLVVHASKGKLETCNFVQGLCLSVFFNVT